MTNFSNSVLGLKPLLVFDHPPLAEIPRNLSWRLQEALQKWEILTRNLFSAFANASIVSMSR